MTFFMCDKRESTSIWRRFALIQKIFTVTSYALAMPRPVFLTVRLGDAA